MKAKVINNQLSYPPSTIVEANGKAICNPTPEQLTELGYKEVIYTERPTLQENECVSEIYTKTESEIIVTYEIKMQEVIESTIDPITDMQ